jgi:hypothetical protein
VSQTPHIVSDVMTRTVVAVGRDAPFKEDEVVTLRGHIRDTSLISVAVRPVHAVGGVVDVEPHLTGESTAPAGPGGAQRRLDPAASRCLSQVRQAESVTHRRPAAAPWRVRRRPGSARGAAVPG